MRFAWMLVALAMFATTTTGAATYADPFAYCATVGTIDSPDARWAGPKMPESIAQGLMAATGAPEGAPLDVFMRNSYWRCMGGKVYACTVGANIPCLEKADTSRAPTAAMREYCRTNPDTDAIPAYVTGRATVYAWACQRGKPLITWKVNRPDERGFLANFWYAIEPAQGHSTSARLPG
jgi:hypothetical protein